MDVAAKLAEKMIELGNEYNIPAFIRYSESLQENIQKFWFSLYSKGTQRTSDFAKTVNGK